MMMDKSQYLQTRQNLKIGNLDENCLELFFQYWTEHKNELFSSPTFEEFKERFTMYLRSGFNYNAAALLVLEHFDSVFGITKVIRIKDNSVLLEF